MVYVDDFILAATNEELHQKIEKELINKFRVKTIGTLTNFLGMQFEHKNGAIAIHQKDYIEDMMKALKLSNITPFESIQPDGLYQPNESDEDFDLHTYQKAIGKLIWLSICTRPDISFYVSYYASFMAQPKIPTWRHLIQLISYIYYTRNYGIVLQGNGPLQIDMYVDSGHANNLLWRRSTEGFTISFLNNIILWASHKIHTVVKSSMEAEYIAISDAALEAKFIRNILKDVFPDIGPICGFTDSEAAKKVVNGNGQVRKIKHLEVRYHLSRQMVLENELTLSWIPSNMNHADLLTKHIGSRKLFETHQKRVVADLTV
jgi:hypothetical protein